MDHDSKKRFRLDNAFEDLELYLRAIWHSGERLSQITSVLRATARTISEKRKAKALIDSR
jgi:hypothetical protein